MLYGPPMERLARHPDLRPEHVEACRRLAKERGESDELLLLRVQRKAKSLELTREDREAKAAALQASRDEPTGGRMANLPPLLPEDERRALLAETRAKLGGGKGGAA